jgi:eukaryotic-like serine/threonine-protein kinase
VKVCPTCQREYPDELRFCQDDGATLRLVEGSDIVGSVIADRYHVTAKIGEGGMGTVYLGRHVKMGRLSAIKIINATHAQDAESIARFHREAANAARINHHNVCAIYDFGETAEGLIYLAMEYVEGETLSHLLDRQGALPFDVAADLITQTAEALQKAHDLGIVHRDLKPDNIMIAKSPDGRLTAKVVDFGIAKAVGPSPEQQVTKTGLVIGTPEYMSPEQLSGDTLDGRTDIYSLGLVAFRMFTGTLPFEGESTQEVMFKRLTDDPLTLREAAAGSSFPSDLQAAIDRALARMPADRYGSARDFAHAVTTAVAAAPASAPAPAPARARYARVGAAGVADPANQAFIPETRQAEAPRSTSSAAPTIITTGSAARWNMKILAGVASAAIAVVAVSATIMMRPWARSVSSPLPASPVTISTADSGDSSSIEGGGSGIDRPGGSGAPTRDGAPSTDSSGPPSGTRPDVITVVTADAGTRLAGILARIDPLFNASPTPEQIVAARDTATAYYDHPALGSADRSTAAFVIGTTHLLQGDTAQAITWTRTAQRLNPADEAAALLLRTLEGNQ